jgi:hypothetical protein
VSRFRLLFGLAVAFVIASGTVFLLTRAARRGFAVRVGVAVVLGLVIVIVGRRILIGFGGPVRERHEGPAEEVGELEVYFLCGECGTEYKVTMLGELSVPRHCGEPMQVVRRPAQTPGLN